MSEKADLSQGTLDVWRMDARRVSQQANEDATRIDQERILDLIDALEETRRTYPEVTITNSGGVATCEVSVDGVTIFSGVDRSVLLQVDRSHVRNLAGEWAARQGPTASDDLYADLLRHAIEDDVRAEVEWRPKPKDENAELTEVRHQRDSLRFELDGARHVAGADNEYLLSRAKKAERALEALVQERNTWARQMADLRDERDTAVAQMETIRSNALGTENDMLADRVSLEARLLDERKDRADVWDEGWRAAHTVLPTFPPKYPTNPYRDDSDHGVEKVTADCGGCQGLGAHQRYCRHHPDYHPWRRLADRAESIGDEIGGGDPGLANQAYALSGEIRRRIEEQRSDQAERTD